MSDFYLDDILKQNKGRSKTSGNKKKKKGNQPTIGQEAVEAIAVHNQIMQERYKPMNNLEQNRLARLIDEMMNSSPNDDDALLINKFIDMYKSVSSMTGMRDFEFNIFDDDDDDFGNFQPELWELAFSLGMAYERLKQKGDL